MELNEEVCALCARPHGVIKQVHHLKPKMFKSRDVDVECKENLALMHKICHQKIHSTFSEHELLTYYHTIDRLLEHEDISKFVKWVSKKDPDFYDKNDDTQSRKRKRK